MPAVCWGFEVSEKHVFCEVRARRLWRYAVSSEFPCLFPPSLLQACSIRDPNSGFVFDLNPLNTSQGYVVPGIGKTFVVRVM